jgi:hypothetical protein
MRILFIGVIQTVANFLMIIFSCSIFVLALGLIIANLIVAFAAAEVVTADAAAAVAASINDSFV